MADELYPDTVAFLNSVFERAGVIFLTARKNRAGLDGELKRLSLLAYADYTISISADEGLLRERLIKRRIATGAEREKAEEFVDLWQRILQYI